MIRSLTLDDGKGTQTAFLTATRKLQQADLAGVTAMRTVLSNRPNRDGSYNRSRYEQDRPVVLNGMLLGATETEVWQSFDDLNYALGRAKDTEQLLRYVRGDGLALQMSVKTDGAMAATVKASDGGVVLPYQAQLRASDPNAYTQNQVLIVGQSLTASSGGLTFPDTYPSADNPSSSGLAAYAHQGTADTWPTIRVYGSAVNPVVHLEDPAQITLVGTVAAGDYLELDASTRSVLLNGLYDRSKMLDVPNTSWFSIPARDSGWIKLTAESGDGWPEVIFRHAYS